MFRFPKTLDPITLFHNPTLPTSNRVLQILKSASTAASEASSTNGGSSSTTDKSAAEALHNASSGQRGEFQLDVTTSPPTTDQLTNIFEYLGAGIKAGDVVSGAVDVKDALKRVKGVGAGEEGFIRPVTVDWINGKAVIGDNESEILRMVRQIPAEGK